MPVAASTAIFFRPPTIKSWLSCKVHRMACSPSEQGQAAITHIEVGINDARPQLHMAQVTYIMSSCLAYAKLWTAKARAHLARLIYFTPVTSALACCCSTWGEARGVSRTARVPAVSFSLMAIIRAAAKMLCTILVFMPL